jgi:hypothetical protein
MYTRVLTELERRQAKAFLKQDGEKTLNIQVLVSRAGSYLPQIKEDVELLRKLVAAYSTKTK